MAIKKAPHDVAKKNSQYKKISPGRQLSIYVQAKSEEEAKNKIFESIDKGKIPPEFRFWRKSLTEKLNPGDTYISFNKEGFVEEDEENSEDGDHSWIDFDVFQEKKVKK